jgi:hypothetical protein
LAVVFSPQQSCLGLGVIFGDSGGPDEVEWDIALLLSLAGAAFLRFNLSEFTGRM